MEGNKMFNQVVDYQKNLFDNAFTIISNAQDQSEAIALSTIEKNPMLPKESLKLITYWSDFFKKNRTNYKSYVDTHFDRIKEMCQMMTPEKAKEKTEPNV